MDKTRPAVLHCIPTLGGGGAERQLTYLCEGSIRHGWRVHIAYLRDGPNSGRLASSGACLHKLSSAGPYDPRILWELHALIRKTAVRVVQTWLTQMDVFGGAAAALSRVPSIVSERASALAYPDDWKNRLRVMIGKRASAVVANSEEGLAYWKSLGFEGPAEVVRNAVPFQEIEAAPADAMNALGIDDTTEVILYAGRYVEQKNLLTLLDALSMVLKERTRAVAVLFGEGPVKQELGARIERSALRARIHALGFNTTLWGALKRADVFVSVSHFEGNPNTVLEAIAARCPLVLSEIAEHLEIVDRDGAFFAPPASAQAIARSIDHALADRNEARRRAQNAVARIASWSVELIAERYLDLYARVSGLHL